MYAALFGGEIPVCKKEWQILLWTTRITIIVDWDSWTVTDDDKFHIIRGALCFLK